jgi:hypothetical protein
MGALEQGSVATDWLALAPLRLSGTLCLMIARRCGHHMLTANEDAIPTQALSQDFEKGRVIRRC